MKKHYLTTPIYYVNGNPHVGHAHTSVMGDILKRSLRMAGMDAFYTSGVDEHGQKNQEEIEKSGLTTEQYLQERCLSFTTLFDSLKVSTDYFVRTSAPNHKSAVTYALEKLWKKGLIIKKKYEGLYCQGCEQFLSEEDLDEAGHCPDHHKPPKLEQEENYFFTLEPFRPWLVEFLEMNDRWISPQFYRNKIIDMLKDPLPDLCISRPKSRVSLGIELPFDRDYVTYVWFDALLNYISSLGYPQMREDFSELWSRSYHLMAKDIIKTHCIYWPIMLHALELPPPAGCLVHGYWIGKDGRKMAKSLGNVVNPQEMADKYGADTLRFFLARNMGRNEARIGEELLESCYVSILSNNLGNAYLRAVKMVQRYWEGRIPSASHFGKREEELQETLSELARGSLILTPDLQAIAPSVEKIEEMGRAINRYLEETAPWNMAKDESETGQKALSAVLRCSLEGVRLLFEAASVVMPQIARKALGSLNISLPEDGLWDYDYQSIRLKEGDELGEVEILFPKLS